MITGSLVGSEGSAMRIYLEFRQKNGNIRRFGYSWLHQLEFDPSIGILLSFGTFQVKLVGRRFQCRNPPECAVTPRDHAAASPVRSGSRRGHAHAGQGQRDHHRADRMVAAFRSRKRVDAAGGGSQFAAETEKATRYAACLQA